MYILCDIIQFKSYLWTFINILCSIKVDMIKIITSSILAMLIIISIKNICIFYNKIIGILDSEWSEVSTV